ncbi:SDR family oxidoreductase [Epidermidibacterium keratini]|uniref:SDR family oxidoreductase n=1 Tax=Epidermidibacterium keratini TaxID=1891644 RepID=A0A7L4YJN7_9ACTN|nr:SDR family oxidoreductase [Epidermidibacterium keratini]QHB99028.1 SDR family oxidoreductase [Epidermidibacterium keratini]
MSPVDRERPTALVTGATRGIGLAIARELQGDYHLLIGGRSEESTAAACAELESAEPFVADLLDDESLAAAAAALPDLDVLVHSAGISIKGSVAEVTRDQWRKAFEANLFAVADLTARALPGLRRRRGQVVAINSGSGFFTAPGNAIYSGTKFALRAFTDVLREEEREYGVRVSSVHPGKVDTDMQAEIVEHDGTTYQPELYLRPESVARAVRTVVDATEDATVEVVSVRPSRK